MATKNELLEAIDHDLAAMDELMELCRLEAEELAQLDKQETEILGELSTQAPGFRERVVSKIQSIFGVAA